MGVVPADRGNDHDQEILASRQANARPAGLRPAHRLASPSYTNHADDRGEDGPGPQHRQRPAKQAAEWLGVPADDNQIDDEGENQRPDGWPPAGEPAVQFSCLPVAGRGLSDPELPPAVRRAWLGQYRRRLSVYVLCRRPLQDAVAGDDLAAM